MLSDGELLRYSRQILLVQVDIEDQLRLKRNRILIVGLGGLDSPVALYLAAVGVGEPHLADFDTVNLTDLQRRVIHDDTSAGIGKAEPAMRRPGVLNPQTRLVSHNAALDGGSLDAVVVTVDLVLDYTDNFAIREAINVACIRANKSLINGTVIHLEGQLSVFDTRRDASPYYRCLYGYGGEAELAYNEAGMVGPLVGLVGSLQALEAPKLLVGFGEPLAGHLLLADTLDTHFRKLRVRRDSSCAICGQRHSD